MRPAATPSARDPSSLSASAVSIFDAAPAVSAPAVFVSAADVFVSAAAVSATPEPSASAAAVSATPEPSASAAAAALAEGIMLIRSNRRSVTGYKRVTCHGKFKKTYDVKFVNAGKQVCLGSFETAEEAALAYARSEYGRVDAARLRKWLPRCEQGDPPAPPPPLSQPSAAGAEAIRQAEREGLVLATSSKSVRTGYEGVCYIPKKGVTKKYQSTISGYFLGDFATAEEAALCIARRRAGKDPPAGVTIGLYVPSVPTPSVTTPAVQTPAVQTPTVQTPAGGLARGSCGRSAFHYVTAAQSSSPRVPSVPAVPPPQVRRQSGPLGHAPAVAAEAEGLRLHLSSSSITGYKGVTQHPTGRYVARPTRAGTVHIGFFDTAVEAAVAYARAVGEEPAAAAAPPLPGPPPPPPVRDVATAAARVEASAMIARSGGGGAGQWFGGGAPGMAPPAAAPSVALSARPIACPKPVGPPLRPVPVRPTARPILWDEGAQFRAHCHLTFAHAKPLAFPRAAASSGSEGQLQQHRA